MAAKRIQIALRRGGLQAFGDTAETASRHQGRQRQENGHQRHQRALQHVGHADRPEPAHQGVGEHHHRPDQHGLRHAEAELGLEGRRGCAELCRDIEDEAEDDHHRSQRRQHGARLRTLPGDHEIGRCDMTLGMGFRPQPPAEEQPDRDVAAPDSGDHPERGEPAGIDKAGKAQQHPGRRGRCRIGQPRHPGAQPLPRQEEIAFRAIATGSPDTNADQHQLVGDQRRQNDPVVLAHHGPPPGRVRAICMAWRNAAECVSCPAC